MRRRRAKLRFEGAFKTKGELPTILEGRGECELDAEDIMPKKWLPTSRAIENIVDAIMRLRTSKPRDIDYDI